jgi:hypothetical protein
MLVAGSIELGNDEVYYRLYADPLQWNYFDHPPMVGWLIRLSTFNLYFDNGFTIRLGAIFCGAVTTWLLYKCGERLLNEYTGFLAALLYTGTIYGSIIAGTFILPDSPQMVCWTGSLLLLIKITESKYFTKKTTKDVLWFGLITGIGMLCKIHTVFLWFGFGLYMLLYNREWLKHWSIYAAAAITIVLFTPVLLWNVQHDFITFTYHGKRVDVATGGLNIESFLTFVGGQVFYTNPIVFFLIARAIWHRDLFVKPHHKRVLLLVGLPLIILASSVSLFKELLPHWTGPAFASLILLTASYYSRKQWSSQTKRKVPLGFSAANWLLLFIAIAGVVLINFFPGTLGNKRMEKKGAGDFTLDMYGWKQFSKSFDRIYHSSHTAHDAGKTIVLGDEWFPAAHIDFYVANPLHIRMAVLGPIDKTHQYRWLNKQRGPMPDSTDLYIISPSNSPIHKENFAFLNGITPAKTDSIIQYRGKEEARRFYIYYYKKGRYHFDPADF